jgi:hypothetical protein
MRINYSGGFLQFIIPAVTTATGVLAKTIIDAKHTKLNLRKSNGII